MSWQIKVEGLSKMYRLGEISAGTLSQDLNRWWHKVRGKEDPYSKIALVNDRSKEAESDFVWALKDINFEVEQGEVLGIIGKNGAGKSTLLKILSQITSPSTGSIKTKGRIASLLEVGTGMHPEMTARENIFLNGAILGMSKKEIKEKFDEIVEFSGCSMYIDTPLKRYSSGMRVRLGFAVAAFLEPEILIVDEVLAVGDAEFQQKAVGKMKDITKSGGRTVLFVSHNMAAIRSLCTRAILMENGTVTASGAPEEIVTKYLEINSSKFVEEAIHPEVDLNSHRKWDHIFVNKVSVKRSTLKIDEPLYVDFDINIEKDLSEELTISIDFCNVEDQIIFGTSQKFENSGSNLKGTCEIPANYLNNIPYYINIYVLDKKLKAIYGYNKVVSFKMDESASEDLFFGKRNGFLRPDLKWSKSE